MVLDIKKMGEDGSTRTTPTRCFIESAVSWGLTTPIMKIKTKRCLDRWVSVSWGNGIFIMNPKRWRYILDKVNADVGWPAGCFCGISTIRQEAVDFIFSDRLMSTLLLVMGLMKIIWRFPFCHGGAPSHHPIYRWIFPFTKTIQLQYGVPPFQETPIVRWRISVYIQTSLGLRSAEGRNQVPRLVQSRNRPPKKLTVSLGGYFLKCARLVNDMNEPDSQLRMK